MQEYVLPARPIALNAKPLAPATVTMDNVLLAQFSWSEPKTALSVSRDVSSVTHLISIAVSTVASEGISTPILLRVDAAIMGARTVLPQQLTARPATKVTSWSTAVPASSSLPTAMV